MSLTGFTITHNYEHTYYHLACMNTKTLVRLGFDRLISLGS